MADRSSEVVKWADDAMYEAQPMLREEGARVKPRVFLLSATPDPLGNLAADMRMYRGDPVYSLDEITDEQRRWAWEELSKTILNTPLEGVQLKFMIEAVTRSFTHQMVRQRVGAYYVQESQRFAVKNGMITETAKPGIVASDENIEKIWDDTITAIGTAYEQLVNAGVPAEDARGLLPHAVTTRIIYTTNLRALFNEAGKRLCTQAQFEWRSVFLGMINAIREYQTISPYFDSGMADAWQWDLIATPMAKTFTPVCYHTGTCAFMSMLDRGCTIRDRVLAFAGAGVPPEQWGQDHYKDPGTVGPHRIDRIDPHEWMADPYAGVTTPSNERPPE